MTETDRANAPRWHAARDALRPIGSEKTKSQAARKYSLCRRNTERRQYTARRIPHEFAVKISAEKAPQSSLQTSHHAKKPGSRDAQEIYRLRIAENRTYVRQRSLLPKTGRHYMLRFEM